MAGNDLVKYSSCNLVPLESIAYHRMAIQGEGSVKKILSLVALCMLAGCQTAEEMQTAIVQATPAPASVKAQIVTAARDTLYDPYSVRDAEISYMQFNKHSGLHWVCVKANAKNRMGGYVGRQALEVWVKNGVLAGNLPNSPACGNPAMKWQRFGELEALRAL